MSAPPHQSGIGLVASSRRWASIVVNLYGPVETMLPSAHVSPFFWKAVGDMKPRYASVKAVEHAVLPAFQVDLEMGRVHHVNRIPGMGHADSARIHWSRFHFMAVASHAVPSVELDVRLQFANVIDLSSVAISQLARQVGLDGRRPTSPSRACRRMWSR